MSKKFGTTTLIGNKRVVRLRYTDIELSSRVVRFLHSRGYRINEDYSVSEYFYKNRKISKIECIILSNDIFQIMAIKQRRVAEIAIKKANQLEINF